MESYLGQTKRANMQRRRNGLPLCMLHLTPHALDSLKDCAAPAACHALSTTTKYDARENERGMQT